MNPNNDYFIKRSNIQRKKQIYFNSMPNEPKMAIEMNNSHFINNSQFNNYHKMNKIKKFNSINQSINSSYNDKNKTQVNQDIIGYNNYIISGNSFNSINIPEVRKKNIINVNKNNKKKFIGLTNYLQNSKINRLNKSIQNSINSTSIMNNDNDKYYSTNFYNNTDIDYMNMKLNFKILEQKISHLNDIVSPNQTYINKSLNNSNNSAFINNNNLKKHITDIYSNHKLKKYLKMKGEKSPLKEKNNKNIIYNLKNQQKKLFGNLKMKNRNENKINNKTNNNSKIISNNNSSNNSNNNSKNIINNNINNNNENNINNNNENNINNNDNNINNNNDNNINNNNNNNDSNINNNINNKINNNSNRFNFGNKESDNLSEIASDIIDIISKKKKNEKLEWPIKISEEKIIKKNIFPKKKFKFKLKKIRTTKDKINNKDINKTEYSISNLPEICFSSENNKKRNSLNLNKNKKSELIIEHVFDYAHNLGNKNNQNNNSKENDIFNDKKKLKRNLLKNYENEKDDKSSKEKNENDKNNRFNEEKMEINNNANNILENSNDNSDNEGEKIINSLIAQAVKKKQMKEIKYYHLLF